MPRYGYFIDLISGRNDPWVIKILRSLIGLAIAIYSDLNTSLLSFTLVYIILVIWTANFIGGYYAIAYAAICGLVRHLSPDMSPIDDTLLTLWRGGSLMLAYILPAWLIIKKNEVMDVLERSVSTDSLTLLLNRRGFIDRLQLAVAHTLRHHEELSIAYIDVDRFKHVNDEFGHAVGDELLRCVGKTITENLRTEDAAARLGGDEFAIIYTTTNHDSLQLIQRLKSHLDKSCSKYGVSFSIGVLHYSGESPATLDELIQFADTLMYKVKKSSKNAIYAKNYEKI